MRISDWSSDVCSSDLLPADRPWPPTEVPAAVVDLGVVDNRPQRTKLLDYLQAQTPIRMLMICDAQQTPDRGVIALLADLAGMARHSRVALQIGRAHV